MVGMVTLDAFTAHERLTPGGRWGFVSTVRLLLLATLVAGCSGTTTSNPPATGGQPSTPAGSAADEPITLRFPTWQADDPGTMKWWQARIDDFESKHPNVTIDMTKVALADHIDKLAVEFAAGQPPQIVHVPVTGFFGFADKGFLEPLDKYLEDTDIIESWTPLQDICKWDGSYECVVMLNYGYGMIYNEQLLADAGVSKVPTTYDELLAAAQAITDTDKGIYGYGAVTAGGAPMTAHFDVWMIGEGAHWTDSDGNVTVNTPEMRAAWEKWVGIVKSGAVPQGLESGPLRQVLTEGKLGFFFDGPWIYGNVAGAPDGIREHLKAAPLPFDHVMGGASNALAIAKDISDREKALVWDFISGGTTQEWQDRYAANVGAPAPRQGSTSGETRAALPFIDVYEAAADQAVNFVPTGLEAQLANVDKLVADQLQAVIAQDKPIEQALQELQAQLEDLKTQ